MTQTQNRVLDEIARMFTNAAGAAQGVRQEVETVIRSQAERLVADLDLVPREEFEVVRAMAALAREENEALKARIEALEAEQAALAAQLASADLYARQPQQVPALQARHAAIDDELLAALERWEALSAR